MYCYALVRATAIGVALVAASAAQATLIGPTAYTDFASGPFGSLGGIVVEDFEDGSLNTPGVTASGGSVLGPGFGLTDSVENAPDGCNPSGLGGGAHTCAGFSYYPGATTLVLTFSGTLPTHAGIVWTDVGFLLTDVPPIYTGAGDVVFEAFDAGSFSLGLIGPTSLGDGVAAPMKGEDRFFGAVDLGGISRIEIRMPNSNDWEVDHLQFGTGVVIPEPGSGALLLLALFALARRRS